MAIEETSIKKVLVNSVIYSFSGLLLKCISFFLLPLYTAFLTTEDYGIINIASMFITVTGFIAAFSIFSATKRFYVDYKHDANKLKRFYGTVVVFTFLSCTCASIILVLMRNLVRKYIFSGIEFFPVILICIVSVAFFCQMTVYDNILKSQQRALKSSIVTIVYFFANLAANIILIVVLKMGATGSVIASLTGYFLYTIYFIVDMKRHDEIIFCLDVSILKPALKYSIPIMPHNLSTQIASLVSIVLIGNTASLSSVGIYSIAAQFGNVADTVQGYIDTAYGPWLYEKLHAAEENRKNEIRETVKILIAVIGLFFLGISLFAHDYIVLFINDSYVESWMYIPLIVSVFAIKTPYYFYVEILFYYKKASKYLFTSTLTSSIVNVILSAILIPKYDIIGSIIADALAMTIRVAIVYFISKRFDDVGLFIKDFVINFLIIEVFMAGGLVLSFLYFDSHFSVFNFIYKTFVVLAYVAIIILMNKRKAKEYFKLFIIKTKQRRKHSE